MIPIAFLFFFFSLLLSVYTDLYLLYALSDTDMPNLVVQSSIGACSLLFSQCAWPPFLCKGTSDSDTYSTP